MDHNYEKTLLCLSDSDSIYQELLQACLALEPEYIRIINTLSKSDKALLERYISLCEELDHRLLNLAFSIK